MMSEQQFEVRWQHHQEQRRAEAAGVTGKWDQADALLLVESGWTQERIAEKVGKSRSYVDQLLRFGRFIDATCINGRHDAPGASIPPTLTEGAFRSAWAKSPKRTDDDRRMSEDERFAAVRTILEAGLRLDQFGVVMRSRPINVGMLVVEAFADGDWIGREAMLADLEAKGVDDLRLDNALNRIKRQNAYGCMLEEKTVKGRDFYRIRRLKVRPEIKSEKVIRFYEAAMPLMKEAKKLSSCNINAVSPQAILHKLVLMEQLIKGLYDDLANEASHRAQPDEGGTSPIPSAGR